MIDKRERERVLKAGPYVHGGLLPAPEAAVRVKVGITCCLLCVWELGQAFINEPSKYVCVCVCKRLGVSWVTPEGNSINEDDDRDEGCYRRWKFAYKQSQEKTLYSF